VTESDHTFVAKDWNSGELILDQSLNNNNSQLDTGHGPQFSVSADHLHNAFKKQVLFELYESSAQNRKSLTLKKKLSDNMKDKTKCGVRFVALHEHRLYNILDTAYTYYKVLWLHFM